MQNAFLENAIEKKRYWFFCAIAGFIAFSTDISYLILNSNLLFHEGEYVGLLWSMRSFYSGVTPFPLLIHGAMDYIPAIVASFIYGDDHVIVGTRAINTIIVWPCWVLFLDLCYLLASKKSERALWVAIVIAIFVALAPAAHSQALIVQQAFLGTRDLFIIATVWSFVKYTAPTSPIRERLCLMAGTISAVIAIFWSYDRGIMALVFLGIMLFGVMINKKALDAMLLVLTACTSLVILQYSNIFGSLLDNVRNIVYWLKYSAEVFGTSISANATSLIITSVVLLFCTATIAIAFINRPDRDKNNNILLVLGILAIQIMLLKIVINRPGLPRLLWATWPSILMMFYFVSRRFSINVQISFGFSVTPSPQVAYKLYFIILLMLIVLTSSGYRWYGLFIRNIFKPQLDTAIVSAEVKKVSDTIRQYNDQCFFGWVNEGVIALMAKKRFCTQYPYAIYVSKVEESNLLQQIKNDSPAAIVFDVTGDSMMDVDNRSMARRLPNVNKFIQDNYPQMQQVGRYKIVSR